MNGLRKAAVTVAVASGVVLALGGGAAGQNLTAHWEFDGSTGTQADSDHVWLPLFEINHRLDSSDGPRDVHGLLGVLRSRLGALKCLLIGGDQCQLAIADDAQRTQ